MSLRVMKIIALLFLFLIFGCSVLAKHQDWKFMQNVGGIIVVGQDKNPNWLILRGNVTGLQEFSAKPTQSNSALAIKKIKSVITQSEIQIYVVTILASDKYNETEISGVNISGAHKGKYKVYYLNPDDTKIFLKEIEVY